MESKTRGGSQRSEMIGAIKKVGFFSSVPEKNLDELGRTINWQDYKKGQRIFEEGEKSDKMFIVGAGRVKVVKEFPNGKSAIIGIFEEGGAIAEIAVIDKKPYPVSAVALEDSVAGAIPADVFVRFLKENPDALVAMIVGLGAKLRDMVGNIGSLAVQSVEKRLARFLVKLSRQIGIKEKEGTLLNLPMTRQDLAEIIGTSFEVVERSLKKMREKGIIKVEGKKIVILKPDKLRELFSEQ